MERGWPYMRGRPMAGAVRLIVQFPTTSAAPSQIARRMTQKPGSGMQTKRAPPSLHMSAMGRAAFVTKLMPSSFCGE